MRYIVKVTTPLIDSEDDVLEEYFRKDGGTEAGHLMYVENPLEATLYLTPWDAERDFLKWELETLELNLKTFTSQELHHKNIKDEHQGYVKYEVVRVS